MGRIESKWWDETNDTMVVFIDLPSEVDEFVTVNDDGSHTVFLRSSMSLERRAIAYTHALWHIAHGDLEDGRDVQTVERIAHAGVQKTA